MKIADKDLQITRMSALKSTVEACNLIGFTPKTMGEYLRVAEMLTNFILIGLDEDVKKDIKKLDDLLKKKNP